MVHCYGDYTTNVALDVLRDSDVLFAYRHDGEPLPPDHGGPNAPGGAQAGTGGRAPSGLTEWSSMGDDAPGFWEQRGYHMEGDPWKEQRFWNNLR